MKIELRLPTADQYAYVGLELGDSEVLTDEMIETAVGDYRRAMGQIKGGEGLADKEFDAFIERQISGEPNTLSQYEKMSPEQQKYVQINKRAIKRANAKLLKSKSENDKERYDGLDPKDL